MSAELTDRLAEALCLQDDTMFHHDRTDDYPCTACKGKATALLPVVQAYADERVKEALDVADEAVGAIGVGGHSHWRKGGAGGRCSACSAQAAESTRLRAAFDAARGGEQ